MSDLNNLSLTGHLAADCVFTTVGNENLPKVDFVLCVNEYMKGAENSKWVNFFNLTIWGDRATKLQQYLKKGTLVAVTAHLHQNRWEKDNQKKSQTVVVCEKLDLLSSASSSTNNSTAQVTASSQQSELDSIAEEAWSTPADNDIF